MPTFEEIYAVHADKYDQLVQHEDYQGHILPALEAIRPLAGQMVVEAGAGTGRLTMLLAQRARAIHAFDGSQHMLSVAQQKVQKHGFKHVQLAVADNLYLPLANNVADIAIEGWSFGHATEWQPDHWRGAVASALAELRRVLRPGGTMVLLETLGTGTHTPQPPNRELADLYAWLQHEQGFNTTWITTDYRFASRAAADEITSFFFGAAMPVVEQPDQQVVVPECTGIWWQTLAPAS